MGDVTNSPGNEEVLRHRSVQFEVLEDDVGISLYAKYCEERPDLDLEDWKKAWRPCGAHIRFEIVKLPAAARRPQAPGSRIRCHGPAFGESVHGP